MFNRLFGGSRVVRHTANDSTIELDTAYGQVSSLIRPYVEERFGDIGTVLHELVSDGLHIDIYVIPPCDKGERLTLVTSGMSERPMRPPRGQEKFKYAELAMCLPPDWPFEGRQLEDEVYYWPIRCLKTLARFPHQYRTWFGAGHTIPNGNPPRPYASNTELCCALLSPMVIPGGLPRLHLERGGWIDFLQVIPINKSEMDYTRKFGYKNLVPQMAQAGRLSIKTLCRTDHFTE